MAIAKEVLQSPAPDGTGQSRWKWKTLFRININLRNPPKNREMIDPASYQPAETLIGEQNSFLWFIDQNKDLFERHTSLTYELRDEEQGWRDSPDVDSIAEKYSDLTLHVYPRLNNIGNKAMRKLKEKARSITVDLVFGNSNETDKLVDKIFPHSLSGKFSLSPQNEVLSKDFDEILKDFRTSFREARAPLVIGVRESKEELLKKFEDFLLSNSENLFAFQDFLSDKKNYGADRDAIRPFLASLVDAERNLVKDKKEGILHQSVKKWVNELRENPTHGIIDEFIPSIKASVLEVLEFAAQGEDIANLFKSRPVSIWPPDLKNAFSVFVAYRYQNALDSVKKDMEQFRRTVSLKSISLRIQPEIEEQIEKVTAREAHGKKPDKKKGKLEEAEKEKYQVGILTKEIGASSIVRVLTEEELTGRLQKEADSLDSSDIRMMEDLKNIFTNLQKDPYGLGTKKLAERFVAVGHRTLPLRSINPRRRIGLSLDHPVSPEIRIVYVIYENKDGKAIGIEGIYTHDDYDKKFTS